MHKPVFMLADSQLLFWRPAHEEPVLGRALDCLQEDVADASLRAAYLGASNADDPQFFELFVAAMTEVGIRDCCHVHAVPSRAERHFLERADIILLAGGDVTRGWQALQEAEVPQLLLERYNAGAVLIGVSAGAVQLGLGWPGDSADAKESLGSRDTGLGLVPYLIDVHNEPEWQRLRKLVTQRGLLGRGLGIPSGGAAVLHPDFTLEPIRTTLVEFALLEDGLQENVLLPPASNYIAQSSSPSPL